MNKNVENFMELDIRVGKIISAEEFPDLGVGYCEKSDSCKPCGALQLHGVLDCTDELCYGTCKDVVEEKVVQKKMPKLKRMCRETV